MKNSQLYIAMLAFVASASFVFLKPSINVEPLTVLSYSQKKLTPLPKLVSANQVPVVSAQAVFVMDVASGVSLYEKNPDAPFLPASTTKIITALVAKDHFAMDEVVTVVNPAVDGQKMGLVSGERLTVENLLNGLLIFSANDAAFAFAHNYPGGIDAFIVSMNNKAEELGLLSSNFTNPAGFDDLAQVTTARDMAILGIYSMRQSWFSEIVAKQDVVIPNLDGTIKHRVKNTNQLLGVIDGVIGIKTGWTENARENLVAYVKKGDREIVIALLGSQDRFGETKQIIDFVLTSYEWENIEVEVL